MQQRQLRLGDILDDYCPRERRLTNHAVVAMVGDEVKQTRCTTCDADHEYKHAKVPRQRRKESPAALQAQVIAGAPKRVVPESTPAVSLPPIDLPDVEIETSRESVDPVPPDESPVAAADEADGETTDEETTDEEATDTEGPAHRRLIRATLPRQEGQPPATRPTPDFTIRHPGQSRQNRFRPRPQRAGGGQPSQGNRSGSGGGQTRGGVPRNGNNRSPVNPRAARRHDGGRKRSK
jgi:hypothetical protein